MSELTLQCQLNLFSVSQSHFFPASCSSHIQNKKALHTNINVELRKYTLLQVPKTSLERCQLSNLLYCAVITQVRLWGHHLRSAIFPAHKKNLATTAFITILLKTLMKNSGKAQSSTTTAFIKKLQLFLLTEFSN